MKDPMRHCKTPKRRGYAEGGKVLEEEPGAVEDTMTPQQRIQAAATGVAAGMIGVGEKINRKGRELTEKYAPNLMSEDTKRKLFGDKEKTALREKVFLEGADELVKSAVTGKRKVPQP